MVSRGCCRCGGSSSTTSPWRRPRRTTTRSGRWKGRLQGDQLNMVVCFCFLAKSDLPSAVYSSIHLTSYFLQGTRLTVHPVVETSWVSNSTLRSTCIALSLGGGGSIILGRISSDDFYIKTISREGFVNHLAMFETYPLPLFTFPYV